MHVNPSKCLALIWLCLALASDCIAQNASATQTANQATPAPFATPFMTGPLKAAAPNIFDAGPFGRLDLNGVLSGMGLWQGDQLQGDESTHADLSSGQIFVQKTTGWWQFYVQAGAYNIPILGTPFLGTGRTVAEFGFIF